MSVAIGIVGASLGATTLALHSQVASAAEESSAAFGTVQATAYQPVVPTRLADTRQDTGLVHVDASTIRVTIPQAAVLGATAVTVTVTAVGASQAGFVTIFPTGTTRPQTSNLNIATAQATVANTATVLLGADASLDVYADHPTNLIVDLVGLYVPSSSASSGRLITMPPLRIVDTRTTGLHLAAGQTMVIPLPAAVPAGSVAAAVNLTFTNTAAPGYFTAWAAGSAQPQVSTGNVDQAGQTRALLTVVPISDGAFQVYSQSGADLIVDLVGYFTGADAAPSSDGLFVPQAPTRVLDTRSSAPLAAGGALETPIARGGAAWMNITTTDAAGPSFVTAYPAGTPEPTTSNVNAPAASVVAANAAVVGVSSRGVTVASAASEQVIIDVFGAYTGAQMSAFLPVPTLSTAVRATVTCMLGVTVEIDRDTQTGRLCDPATGRLLAPEFPITTRSDQPDPGLYPIFERNVQSFAFYPAENTTVGASDIYLLPEFIGFTFGVNGGVIGLHAVPRKADGTLLQPFDSLGQEWASGNRFSLGCVHIPDDVMDEIWSHADYGDVVRIVT